MNLILIHRKRVRLNRKFGWGRYGSNRWHYIPSQQEILRAKAMIRECWDEETKRNARGGLRA